MHLGPLAAEVTNPESEKFTASLLLVHGLWERPTTWRRFAGYLAHRGWRCVAVERRADAVDLAAHVRDLCAAVAALEAPPIVIGHDLGGILALGCSGIVRALVALAPLVASPVAAPPAALQHAGNWLARWRGAPLHAPRGRWRNAYPNREVAEPAPLVRQILSAASPLERPAGDGPRAVFAAEEDEVTPVPVAEALAQHVGAELQVIPGAGHDVLTAPGWETRVAALHRWMIRRSGVDLLALYD
jgi:pimeloyl-ACP methyl ester carboxylesterase